MRLLIILLFSISASATDNEIRLENNSKLIIKQIQPSRILPHAYHDQAISSIPGVYPNSEIITTRRLGYLGREKALLYSLVCYKEFKDIHIITISGVLVHKNQAWSFDIKANESEFIDTLMLVYEQLSKLPFN